MMNKNRTSLGFERTTCSCSNCTLNCKFIPGYLIPEDIVTISRRLGYEDTEKFAQENLLASPGATVMKNNQVFQIPTLVPQRRKDGACKFLDENNRCTIHAESPYGCAFFDVHQSSRESDKRSSRGLVDITMNWQSKGLYSHLWRLLTKAGLLAPNPKEAREQVNCSLYNSLEFRGSLQ
jgi:Fe-S-cluster containining protein